MLQVLRGRELILECERNSYFQKKVRISTVHLQLVFDLRSSYLYLGNNYRYLYVFI